MDPASAAPRLPGQGPSVQACPQEGNAASPKMVIGEGLNEEAWATKGKI